MKKYFMALIMFILLAQTGQAQDHVFRTILMRAAPGKLLSLIDLLNQDIRDHAKYGMEKPYLMRHSQGDQWDLLMVIPVVSIHEHFSAESTKQRQEMKFLDRAYADSFYDYISHHEELFAVGPTSEQFKKAFEAYDYFHVEMFVALAGKRVELLKQRQMENVFLKEIGRPENLIFTKVLGSRWDCFTIGTYRDIQHFAESAESPELEEQAALKAGFKGVNFIGSYLRELILEHHDTLAGKVE